MEINFLPWRILQREQAKKRFNIIIISLLFIVGISCCLIDFKSYMLLYRQQQHNKRLIEEIKQITSKITAIKNIKLQMKPLISAINYFISLQNNRILLLHFLDEINNIIANKNIYINNIQENGTEVKLQGFAQSNSAVSLLIKNINNNSWMKSANLIEIKKTDNSQPKTFIVKFTLEENPH